MPIYRWTPQNIVFDQINSWWKQNANEGKTSIIYCYALGKAQRIQAGVDPSIGRILTHGSVERINQAYRASGVALPETIYAKAADKADYKRALIIAPLSARGTTYIRRFGEHASGLQSAAAYSLLLAALSTMRLPNLQSVTRYLSSRIKLFLQ